MNKRVMEYMQNKWTYFEFSYKYKNKNKYKKRVERNEVKDFSKYLLGVIKEPAGMSFPLRPNEFSSILHLRRYSDKNIEKLISKNLDEIKLFENKAEFACGSVVFVKTPGRENIIMSISDNIYKDELAQVNLVGMGFIADKELKPVKSIRYLSFRREMSEIRLATKDEIVAFETANVFYRMNRDYGVFKTQDLLYNKDMDAYAFYNNKNDREILEALLRDKVYLVGEKSMLDYIRKEGSAQKEIGGFLQ